MAALVSMDSTMRSNLGVGPPIELVIYRTDALQLDKPHRFEEDSDFLRDLKRNWDARLKDAFGKCHLWPGRLTGIDQTVNKTEFPER